MWTVFLNPVLLAAVLLLNACAAGSTLIPNAPSALEAEEDRPHVQFVVDEVRTDEDGFDFDEGANDELIDPIFGVE